MEKPITNSIKQGIEHAYLEASAGAADMDKYYQTGNGSIPDFYDRFYLNFHILFDLSEPFSSKSDEVKAAEVWLDLPELNLSKASEVKARCRAGVKTFRAYINDLAGDGVITL